MSRRLEIELTSERPDGTWTWRAAGAKQPKGELQASILPDGVQVGDVVRADADFLVEGIEILSVLPPKAARKEPERLTIVGTRTDEPLVTTQLAPKGRGGRGDRPDRGRRGDRPGGGRDDRGPRRDGPGGRTRPGETRGEGRGGGDRPRGPRPDPVPERPKPKRLRPGRQHRSAVLDELPVEHRPIAEQVLRGGVPAVREAIAKQNEQAKQENRPEVPAGQLVALAEQLLPSLRAAEWLDRAESALKDLEELDLRDLRSVVVAADGAAKGEDANALLEQIQTGLARRVEEEQALWISDITANLDAGRFVRALRLSSRSPKAGAPLPPELATRLIVAVSEGLTPTVNQDLWAAAVDALAYSPVRNQVAPAGRPEQPSEALLDAVKRVGDRLPKIVELFGLDPAEVAKAAKKRSRGGARAKAKSPKGGKPAEGKPAEGEAAEGKPVDGPSGSGEPATDQGAGADAPASSGSQESDSEVSSASEETLPTGESVPQNEHVDVAVESAEPASDAPEPVTVPAEAERVISAELAGEPQAPVVEDAPAPEETAPDPAATANAEAVDRAAEGQGIAGGDADQLHGDASGGATEAPAGPADPADESAVEVE